MNHEEEQKSELEAISEIYYNEIKVISSEPPISFSIAIRPQASSYQEPEALGADADDDDYDSDDEDDDDGEDDNFDPQPSVELLFELPPNYPDSKPSIQIVESQNLEEEDLSELLESLSKKADESLGTVMIFMLVSDIVEWLSSKAEEEVEIVDEEKEIKRKELEAEEKRKIEGTPVTVESFLAWKAKFEAELLKARIEQQKKQNEQNPSGQKRLTGREMFETDKALAESDLNFVDDLEQEQLEALMQNIDEVNLDDDNYEEDDDDDEEEELDEEFSDSDDTTADDDHHGAKKR